MADATSAREQAREILSGGRYRDTQVPRPFKGPVQWVGDRLEDVGDWFSGLFDDVDGALPGGSWLVWILLGIAVAVAAALVARAGVRRREARAAAGLADAAEPVASPRDLEREADAAERAGDFERAVRLRFRAGVRRLDLGESETTGAIAAQLSDAAFDRVGSDHDAIAYGGRPAEASDAACAREGWREVLR